jgi:hypothetical protein
MAHELIQSRSSYPPIHRHSPLHDPSHRIFVERQFRNLNRTQESLSIRRSKRVLMEDSVSVGMYGRVSTVSAPKKQYGDKGATRYIPPSTGNGTGSTWIFSVSKCALFGDVEKKTQPRLLRLVSFVVTVRTDCLRLLKYNT